MARQDGPNGNLEAAGGGADFRRPNLAGDGQGDLGGHSGEQRAIMVYQLESYRYCRQLQDLLNPTRRRSDRVA